MQQNLVLSFRREHVETSIKTIHLKTVACPIHRALAFCNNPSITEVPMNLGSAFRTNLRLLRLALYPDHVFLRTDRFYSDSSQQACRNTVYSIIF